MPNYLMMIEVSQKQAYIFGREQLRENALRSERIRKVTSSEYFAQVCPEEYNERDNMVNTGGGHTVLQFEDKEQAQRFARQLTQSVMSADSGLELFVKLVSYAQDKTPAENMRLLTEALETKKSLRKTSFRRTAYGVEKITGKSLRPEPVVKTGSLPVEIPDRDSSGYFEFVKQFEDFAGTNRSENCIAVVHIDGNSMGQRVQALAESAPTDWEEYRTKMQRFSNSIDEDFRVAFDEMTDQLAESIHTGKLDLGLRDKLLPIRLVVRAGDDVCFVTSGSVGIMCAEWFLKALLNRINEEDEKPYYACAGVAIVHLKYPFHRAYDLSEQLCDNAKKLCASLRKKAGSEDYGVSAIDWHIEFGQVKDSLGEIREDYIADDGSHMELRPLVVCGDDDRLEKVRHLDVFYDLSDAIKSKEYPASKIKPLRSAIRSGEEETNFYAEVNRIKSILDIAYSKLYEDSFQKVAQDIKQGKKIDMTPYYEVKNDKGEAENHCVLFDAIELKDRIQLPIKEV